MMVGAERSRRWAPRWVRRLTLLRRRHALLRLIETGTLLAAITIALISYQIVTGQGSPERALSPPLVALLLVANLVPAIALMVLVARRVATARAARSPIGGRARLHVRLVAMFSAIAAVPTLLVVIFASLLFQYGVAFWFSDSARTVLENADRVAQAYVDENKVRVSGDIAAMRTDFARWLAERTVDDPDFPSFMFTQVVNRGLTEAALISVGQDGMPRAIAAVFVDTRPVERRMPPMLLGFLDSGRPSIEVSAGDRVEARVAVDPRARIYLYASRHLDPVVLAQVSRTRSALGDYRALTERSRTLQLRFNAALLLVSLLTVAAAIWIAFKVADRLVRPVSDLVAAVRQVGAGDLRVRVAASRAQDEVGTLAAAFNGMTRRLEEQTGALVSANAQLDSRRALTEAVLSGVSAGVVSVDASRCVRLLNTSAAALLNTGAGSPVGQPLATVAPELARLLDGDAREAVVQLASGGEARTLAVKIVRAEGGHVLTFDDITQQLADQRRAAWADVARRIAHEIKNPLTPIQLAAERLQRRYGKEVPSDPGTFERLTGTIVRQVGDLRRMVDEFSSFARMPKPMFRPEPVAEIARQALFLHEVAHPAVRFVLEAPSPSPILVCDRRQLGQALTNLVKNGVEAIEARAPGGGGTIRVAVAEEDGRLVIEVADDGIGLPAERERLTEPYVTTRVRGTGLGLAIVKKIVAEHNGTMAFTDREGGGTRVRLAFDIAALAALAGTDGIGDEGEGALPEPLKTRIG